jgi:hypothetical protein
MHHYVGQETVKLHCYLLWKSLDYLQPSFCLLHVRLAFFPYHLILITPQLC